MSIQKKPVLIVLAVGAAAAAHRHPYGPAAAHAVAPFTAAQATAGRTAYEANCAQCHGADLGGRNDASALAGGLFMGSWGNRSTADLLGFMEGSMPPGNPGRLGEENYLNIAAFILTQNGARQAIRR